MTSNKVRIVMTEHGKGEVYLNGEKLEGVRCFDVSGGIGSLNSVRVEILSKSVEVEMVSAKVTTFEYAVPDDNDVMDNQE